MRYIWVTPDEFFVTSEYPVFSFLEEPFLYISFTTFMICAKNSCKFMFVLLRNCTKENEKWEGQYYMRNCLGWCWCWSWSSWNGRSCNLTVYLETEDPEREVCGKWSWKRNQKRIGQTWFWKEKSWLRQKSIRKRKRVKMLLLTKRFPGSWIYGKHRETCLSSPAAKDPSKDRSKFWERINLVGKEKNISWTQLLK